MKGKINKIVFLFSMGMLQPVFAAFNPIFFGLVPGLVPRLAHEEEPTLGEQLEQAFRRGDLITAAFLLEIVDPNQPDGGGMTLAMKTLMLRNKLERIRRGLFLEEMILLANSPGFDPNLRNRKGDTVFILAAKLGCRKALERLLDLPNIDINARGCGGNTIMHLVAINVVNSFRKKHWNRGFRKILAYPGLDPSIRNDNGHTAEDLLEVAQDNINELRKIFQVAQETRPVPPAEQELADIIMGDDIAELREYLDEHPDLNINWQHPVTKRTLLIFAVATGDPEVVEELLRRFDGYDFNLEDNNGKTALAYAQDNRDERIIAILEEKMAKVSESEQ